MKLTRILVRSLVDYKSNPMLVIPPLVSMIVTFLTSDYYLANFRAGTTEASDPAFALYPVWFLFGFELFLGLVALLVILGQISMTGKVILTGKTRLSEWRVGLRRYFWRTLGIGAVFLGIAVAVVVLGMHVYVSVFILPAIASHPSTLAASSEFTHQPYPVLGSFFLVAVYASIFYMCLASAVLDDKGVGASISSGFKALKKSGRSYLGFLGLFFLVPLLLGSATLTPDLLANQSLTGFLKVPSLLSMLLGALFSPLWYLMLFRMYSESGVMPTVGTAVPSTPANTKVRSNCAARLLGM